MEAQHPAPDPSGSPTRPVRTFLLTDVEGSSVRWARQPDAMAADLQVHDNVVSTVIARHGGRVFSTAGDAFNAVFDRSEDAVAAAVAIQLQLDPVDWQVDGGILIRIGVHAGPAQHRRGNYFGATLNETARLMSAAHGGQVVVSAEVGLTVSDQQFTDLGLHRLKDVDGAIRIYEVVIPGLPSEHPPLRADPVD